jgi:hypothetical protein
MELAVETSRALYSADAQSLDVLLTLTALDAGAQPEGAPAKRSKGAKGASAKSAPPPLYLSCVLDVSGSMDGRKIAELAQTMSYISKNLCVAAPGPLPTRPRSARALPPPTLTHLNPPNPPPETQTTTSPSSLSTTRRKRRCP